MAPDHDKDAYSLVKFFHFQAILLVYLPSPRRLH